MGVPRAEDRKPADRRAGRGARHRLDLHAGRGEHGALARLVADRQCRATLDLRRDHLRHHRLHLDPRLRHPARPRRSAARHLLPRHRGRDPGRHRRRLVRRLFWFVGAFSLFAAALGIVDYTSRLAADVLRTSYLRTRSESLVYAWLVWAMVAAGIAAIASGLSQPLVLLVTSACIAAFMMFVYSALLIVLNRRLLAPPSCARPATGSPPWSGRSPCSASSRDHRRGPGRASCLG